MTIRQVLITHAPEISWSYEEIRCSCGFKATDYDHDMSEYLDHLEAELFKTLAERATRQVAADTSGLRAAAQALVDADG